AVLTYSHLIATDAAGKQLTARMETNSAGDHISLIVDDANAQYPIIIDPITATLKQKIIAPTPQQDARFGFAVALGGLAAIGSWREDVAGTADVGAVYVFVRDNLSQNWMFEKRFGSVSAVESQQCGWSVAAFGSSFIYGCPGQNNNIGVAFLHRRDS